MEKLCSRKYKPLHQKVHYHLIAKVISIYAFKPSDFLNVIYENGRLQHIKHVLLGCSAIPIFCKICF